MGEPVHLELTGDEGIVLFEFLARFDNNGMLTIQDKAEERALSKLHGLLEKQLIEPFHTNYKDLLRAAQERMVDPVE